MNISRSSRLICCTFPRTLVIERRPDLICADMISTSPIPKNRSSRPLDHQYRQPKAQRDQPLPLARQSLLQKNLLAIANGTPNPASGLIRRETAPEAREIIARERAKRAWIEEKRILRKRDLTGRANGTIDPFYGCLLRGELEDYALNFSLPWSM